MDRKRFIARDSDSDATLEMKDMDDDTGKGSSDLSRSAVEEGDTPEPSRALMHTFDNEDFMQSPLPTPTDAAPRRSYRNLFRFRRKPEAGYAAVLPAGVEAVTRQKMGSRKFLRVLFNYPEPDLQLRSTAWLDGLRGLAAFEVFVFHYNHGWVDEGLGWGDDQYSDPPWWRAPFVRTLYASGSAAVCVFFAISGYVLSHRVLSLYRQKQHEKAYASLSSAVFRRAIRLYLPVFLLSFVLMLLCRIFPNLPKATGYEPQRTFFGEIANWITTMVHMLVPLRYPDRWYYLVDQYGGGVSWTIPLEYYGSIVIFIALLFVSRIRDFTTRMGIILAMVTHSFIKDDWTGGQFLLGMAYADYTLQPASMRKPSPLRRVAKTLACYFLFIFGFYLAGLPGFHAVTAADDKNEPGHLHPTNPDAFPILPRPGFDWITQPISDLGFYRDRAADRYLECIAGLCALIGLGESPFLRRWITETRPVQYLGKISFGLYLCHVPMRAWFMVADPIYLRLIGGVDPAVPLEERGESTWLFLAYLVRMVPVVVINFVVAGAFERWVDRPSVQLGKKFETWCLSWAEKWGEDDEAPNERATNTRLPT